MALREILLIEDSEDDFVLTRDMLAEETNGRFALQWCSSYEAGLKALAHAHPDVLLVDYRLGARSGVDFLQAARQAGCRAPAILLTGLSDYDVASQALQAGFTDYLEKARASGPLLERSIRFALERQQILDQLEARVVERTRALAESNELFEKLFSSIHLHVAYLDRSFNFIRVNRRYAESDGRTEDFFPGKNHFELYPSPENEAIFRDVVRTGNPFITRARPFVFPEHPERGVTYWDWHLIPVQEPDGNVSGLIFSLLDVTEQQRELAELRRVEAELSEIQSRLIDGVEAERLQLARELHDGPIQDLYALEFQLSVLSESLPGGAEDGNVAALQASIQRIINTLRSKSIELRPPTLARSGLGAAIRSHCERIRRTQPKLDIQLDLQDPVPEAAELPERMRLALYRIFQMAFTNVVRHAKATLVTVRLRIEPDQVCMEVEDDGVGFQVPERWIEFARQGHLGLVGARERVDALEGEMQVISHPGQGTRVTVVVPRKVD